jgi:cytochrome c oxidase cbb3-type subunit 1
MWNWIKIVALGVIALFAAVAANWARDLAYQVHMLIVMAIAAGLFIWTVRKVDEPSGPPGVDEGEYMDGVIRYGVVATAFWGVVGFLIGTFIAFQLAFPQLNMDWTQGFGNFGRLRPLHTSAVIFAFGGNALIATSFYVVQRTSAARLWGGNLAWFVFWGYNLFIVLAATGYLLGATQSKEYAEPEWYVDLWLTVVWVAYLLVFLGTIIKRKEPHIYVANWFYLAFIVTIAMLHIVNNLVIPVSIFGSRSVQVFAGVQDAMTQWWYGHNAVGFFLTAGFLGMMYYFVPKQAGMPVYSYKLSIIHFWALIFLYIWAGPHHLHYTALPDWASTLGMVFSIILWMPSWGGMINGLMTLSGAWDKIRTDPIIRMMVISLGFYGMSTFEGPMMSIRAVNSLSHYTDWTIGHVHSGALGWNGMITFAALYFLVPKLWYRERLYSLAMVNWHFWLATIGIVLYAASMWVTGIMEGLMWREVDPQGFLVNSFADTVAAKFPMYVVRALGGVLYLSGALIMVYNLWMTAFGRQQPKAAIATPAE